MRDAVWELLLEAADTLRRLPNREQGWLTAAARAHWPDYVRNTAEEFAGAVGSAGRQTAPVLRPTPARAEAIDRMDTVLLWLPLAGGANARRDVSILFELACGLRVQVLRQRFGCGRRTVYDVRDRGVARICGWLRSQSELCRKLE
ncbi:DUF6362 family protein [Pelagibius marinus]|uniref:DUF6362 family protein n=1 Tax=Pelagibius marinus TaxID=2762760 RepID=UPI001873057D|nr:DUF6362 family protein [Pelagibius marinus]